MIQELIQRFQNEYDLSVFVALGAAVIVFIIELVLYSKGIIFSGEYKKLEEAKKRGHITRGTMTYYTREYRGEDGKDILHVADYEFRIDGEKGSRRVVTTGVKPPKELEFYWVDSTKKVFSEYDLRPNPLKILLYIVPLAVGVLVMSLF